MMNNDFNLKSPGKTIMTITPEGEVTFGEGVTPNEAALYLSECLPLAIEEKHRDEVKRLKNRVDQLEEALRSYLQSNDLAEKALYETHDR